MRRDLEKLVDNCDLASKVRLTGAIAPVSLAEHYHAADVLVHPALMDKHGDVEGLGLVLLEAMHCGLPVIASDSGGILDIVANGTNGLLVPEGNPQALAQAIVNLLEHPSYRTELATRAHTTSCTAFGLDAIAARVCEVYEMVVRQH